VRSAGAKLSILTTASRVASANERVVVQLIGDVLAEIFG
jgi:hypothetical protein